MHPIIFHDKFLARIYSYSIIIKIIKIFKNEQETGGHGIPVSAIVQFSSFTVILLDALSSVIRCGNGIFQRTGMQQIVVKRQLEAIL
jgi:hypothetical protein